MLKYFEIPPLKMLTGQIHYELEYKVWIDKHDEVYIIKTRDPPQEPENPNIIKIKFVMSRNGDY